MIKFRGMVNAMDLLITPSLKTAKPSCVCIRNGDRAPISSTKESFRVSVLGARGGTTVYSTHVRCHAAFPKKSSGTWQELLEFGCPSVSFKVSTTERRDFNAGNCRRLSRCDAILAGFLCQHGPLSLPHPKNERSAADEEKQKLSSSSKTPIFRFLWRKRPHSVDQMSQTDSGSGQGGGNDIVRGHSGEGGNDDPGSSQSRSSHRRWWILSGCMLLVLLAAYVVFAVLAAVVVVTLPFLALGACVGGKQSDYDYSTIYIERSKNEWNVFHIHFKKKSEQLKPEGFCQSCSKETKRCRCLSG